MALVDTVPANRKKFSDSIRGTTTGSGPPINRRRRSPAAEEFQLSSIGYRAKHFAIELNETQAQIRENNAAAVDQRKD